MLRRFAATLLATLALVAAAAGSERAQQGVSDVVMILPFENTSGQKEFNWVGESFSDQLAEIRGSARMIRVNEGRIAGRETREGRWETHEFMFGDALLNLQTVQGKLAYEILYEQDDKLPFSQKSIVEQATKVPQKAFEARVKATMTSNQEARLGYLTNALKEFERANPGSVYKEAAFELGHLHYEQRPPDY